MTGARLALALATIAVLTFVVPPLAATRVHQHRIAAAHEDVARIVQAIRAAGGPDVLFEGPGDRPKLAEGVTWHPGAPVSPLPVLSPPMGPDPWGNRYTAVRRGAGSLVAAISAGPNGILETPLDALESPRGDDIVSLAR